MTVEFEDSIPLPVGTQVPRSTVSANPVMEFEGENIQVHDETDRGWPVLITYEFESHTNGIVVDYLGAWHSREVGMEEVDLLIGYKDGEWSWWTIVAFSSKNEAINRGRYGVDGYEGCELVPWNTDGRFGRMMELMDEDVTPIAYTEGKPQYPAHAIQEADDIHVLNRMFGLDDLETLEKRRERLFEKVVPREVRWQDKDTSLRDLARDIEDQEDDEDSEE